MKVYTKARDILAVIEPKIAKVILDIEGAERRVRELATASDFKESKEKQQAKTVIEERLKLAKHIRDGLAKMDRQIRSIPDASIELDATESSLLGYVELS